MPTCHKVRGPGTRYGDYVILEKLSDGKNGGLWKCRCDCGVELNRIGTSIRDSRCRCGHTPEKRFHGPRKPREATLNSTYRAYWWGTTSRDMVPLEKDAWLKIVQNPCHYCGSRDSKSLMNSQQYKRRAYLFTSEQKASYDAHICGIDRIDSAVGYQEGNIVPCCGRCNWMKSDMSQSDFLAQAKRITEWALVPKLRLIPSPVSFTEKTTIDHYYLVHKQSAKQRSLNPMSREQWEKLVFSPCDYCAKIDLRTFGTNRIGVGYTNEVRMNGVDRVDSERGYSAENCVPCCMTCNAMKTDHSKTDFLQHVQKIVNHLKL